MPKNGKDGTLCDFQTCILLQNYKKLEGGPLGDILKNSKKKAQCRKNQKEDPLASAGFLDYVKKVLNERGDPLETKKFSKKSRTQPKKNSKAGTL